MIGAKRLLSADDAAHDNRSPGTTPSRLFRGAALPPLIAGFGLADKEAGLQAQIEIARLLLRVGGFFKPGFARDLLPGLATAVGFAILAARFLPAAPAFGGARGRSSVAIPDGFAHGSTLPLVAGLPIHSAIPIAARVPADPLLVPGPGAPPRPQDRNGW